MRKFLQSILDALFPPKPVGTIERPSPKIRITEEQARAILAALKLIPGYENCFIAAIAPTNSFDPTIDEGMYVVLDPVPVTDLIVGDIIYYVSPTYEAIHRIIRLGDDGEWWANTKGDNNDREDGIKVRASYLKGVWRCTLN